MPVKGQFGRIIQEVVKPFSGLFTTEHPCTPGGKAPDRRVNRNKVCRQVSAGLLFPQQLPLIPGESGQALEEAALQEIRFQVIAAPLHVGRQDVGIFLCQPFVIHHDFRQGLRRAPSDASGFVVQAPHQAPHDVPGCLHVLNGKPGDLDAQHNPCTPPDLIIPLAEGCLKRPQGLPDRYLAEFGKVPSKTIGFEQCDNFFP